MLFFLLLAGFTFVIGEAKDHEIVYPRMIVSRTGDKRVLFRAFDQDFHLRLEPVDVLTDHLVLLTRDDEGEEVFFKPNVDYLRETVLQDPKAGSTIHIDESGPMKIKGVINEGLRIEPVLSGHYKGHGGQNDETEEERQEPTEDVPHRVYKVAHTSKDPNFFDDEVLPDDLKYNLTEPDTEARGDTIIVEIGVVLDITHASRFGSNHDQCIIYHLILINCVNLRFKTMQNSNVRFVLTVIQRNSLSRDQPYITDNTVDGHILSSECLYAFCDYVRYHELLSKVDLVELVTAQPLGDIDDATKKINPGVIGIAFVGGACSSRYKCGISEDDGSSFSGCDTFAHECGHSLSCPHDGSPASIQGSPGASQCPWNWGMIMSYIREDEKQFAFSSCCESCVKHFGGLRSARCLFSTNVNSDITVTDDRLPGEYLMKTTFNGATSLESFYDYKCKLMRDDRFLYQVFENKCVKSFRCRNAANRAGSFYYWEYTSGAGDPCGSGKVCKNGYCVPI